jgi:hypothetical protein
MKEREEKKEKSSHASLVGPTCSLSSSISTPSPWLCERRGWGMGLTGGEGLQQARVRPWPAARAQRERWPGSTRRGRAGRQRAQWGLRHGAGPVRSERGRSEGLRASMVRGQRRRWRDAEGSWLTGRRSSHLRHLPPPCSRRSCVRCLLPPLAHRSPTAMEKTMKTTEVAVSNSSVIFFNVGPIDLLDGCAK